MPSPDLATLFQGAEHPEVGEVHEVELSPQEFLQVVRACPAHLWKWHQRRAERFGGVFSLAHISGSGRVYWRIGSEARGDGRVLVAQRQEGAEHGDG